MIKKRTYIRKLTLFWEQLLYYVMSQKSQVIAWLAAGIYSFVLLTLFFGPLFKINKITCKVNRPPACPDFVIPELSKYKYLLIYFVSTDVLSQKIHLNIPQAREVIVNRIWPHTLEASIVWQDPIAQVAIPASSSAYLVADSGKIIGAIETQDSQLPIITATSAADLIINETISDDTVLTAFAAIKYFAGSSNPVLSASIEGPYMIQVALQQGQKVLLTSMKPISTQLRALQLILSQTTMNQRNQMIDVRYDKSVIKSVSN